eukprot:6190571-Pleurochrysis_carterae.AAC.3
MSFPSLLRQMDTGTLTLCGRSRRASTLRLMQVSQKCGDGYTTSLPHGFPSIYFEHAPYTVGGKSLGTHSGSPVCIGAYSKEWLFAPLGSP